MSEGSSGNIKVYLGQRMHDRTVEIFIFNNQFGQENALAKPIELVMEPFKDERDGKIVPPTMEIHRDLMQAIVDAAYLNGFKPTTMPESAQELSAVKYHLEDMRKIAFKK